MGMSFPVARATSGESREAYEIVAGAAVPLLPDSLQPLFEARLDEVRRSAIGEIIESGGPDVRPKRDHHHFIMLDVAARGGDQNARRAAAHEFPESCAAARKLFKRHGVDRDQGGMLPWIIMDRYRELVGAFEDGEEGLIARKAGVLLHFVTDAALPFNTTSNRDGQAAGHLSWSAEQGSPNAIPHRTVRYRCQGELIRRSQDQLQYEVRVWPERFQRVGDPSKAVFAILGNSHSYVGPLLEIDADLISRLRITGADSFVASADEYYELLAARAGPIVESRLEAAALLTAELIAAAWAEAGSPLSENETSGPLPAAKTSPTASPAEHPYVGSRNSTVFHRVDCPHARRIKAENRVHFETVEEALAAGRTPCKACRPDAE